MDCSGCRRVLEGASETLAKSPLALLTILVSIATVFLFLEHKNRWTIFRYLPAVLWIYLIPVLLRRLSLLPAQSPIYGVLKDVVLPSVIVLLILPVNVFLIARTLKRALPVMLLASFSVAVAGLLSYLLVRHWLGEGSWKIFGTLAGSWIGGTGNMAAVAKALEVNTQSDEFGLAVLADNFWGYLVWLPILIGSNSFCDRFNSWLHIGTGDVERSLTSAADGDRHSPRTIEARHLVYLTFIGLSVVGISKVAVVSLPEFPPVLTSSTWSVLIVTTFGVLLSFTPLRTLPGAQRIGMALLYVFVASMGAQASPPALREGLAFMMGAGIWLLLHGAMCVIAALVFRIDLHLAVVASAANIGGVASAPVVAAAHRQGLVPISLLMALLGYTIANYLAVAMAYSCSWLGG